MGTSADVSLGSPLRQPRFPNRCNIFHNFVIVLVGAWTEVFASLYELLQHQLGISDHRIVGVVIFINVYRIVCCVDEGLTRTEWSWSCRVL